MEALYRGDKKMNACVTLPHDCINIMEKNEGAQHTKIPRE